MISRCLYLSLTVFEKFVMAYEKLKKEKLNEFEDNVLHFCIKNVVFLYVQNVLRYILLAVIVLLGFVSVIKEMA